MYCIVTKFDGTIEVEGHAQDGAEKWTCNTMEEAVDSLIEFAKIVNGTCINAQDIDFGYEEIAVGTKIKWQHK